MSIDFPIKVMSISLEIGVFSRLISTKNALFLFAIPEKEAAGWITPEVPMMNISSVF